MMESEFDQLISAAEVAVRLKVSEATVNRLAKTGRLPIPANPVARKRRRWRLTDIEEFQLEQEWKIMVDVETEPWKKLTIYFDARQKRMFELMTRIRNTSLGALISKMLLEEVCKTIRSAKHDGLITQEDMDAIDAKQPNGMLYECEILKRILEAKQYKDA